jgi:hypothetical protein
MKEMYALFMVAIDDPKIVGITRRIVCADVQHPLYLSFGCSYRIKWGDNRLQYPCPAEQFWIFASVH